CMEETPCEMYGVVEDEEHWLERWEGGASGICWRRDRRPVGITGVPLAGRMGMGGGVGMAVPVASPEGSAIGSQEPAEPSVSAATAPQ
ncbi:hypothetical protein NQZ68_001115, partial [Dissostichus eleginoides]